MYVSFVSHEQVNLYTTFEHETIGVLDFNGKYTFILNVLWIGLIFFSNFSFINFVMDCASFGDSFPE